MTIVNAIAKWHLLGERIRKREPRGRNLKGRGERAYARMRNRRHSKALQDAEPTSAANPSLPLGVSRDTDTKLINSDSVSEK